MTLADIKRLDAGQHFSPAFAGERIPTLAQVFEALDPPALINIELKNNMSPFDALPEKTAILIKRYSVEARVIISCFNPLSLSRIQHFLPDVPVALLALPGSAGCLSRCWLGRWFSPRLIHPHFGDVNAKMITAEHHQNRRVIAYTVDDPAVMERLFNAKIDGIITNDPRLARRVLASR